MPSQSLFSKLLKKRSGCSHSPERTPRSKVSRKDGNVSVNSLPGQCFSDSDFSDTEKVETATSMPIEDEAMHLKWERVLAGRHVSKLSTKELQELEDSGMPLKHRHALWPEWFTAPAVGSLDQSQSVPDEVAKQIDADVARTQPQLLGACERRTLKRVLRAYAAKNPSVGYCQGMNNIAATFILLGFDEAMSLRGVYSLLQGTCPGYHDRELTGFRQDAAVLAALAKRVLPAETLNRLEALDIPLDVLCSEHFLTLASKSWPLASTARLWDVILQEGSPALFASFLALLQLYLPTEQDVLREAQAAKGDDGPEAVDIFRNRLLKGASMDMDVILREVRALIPKVQQSTINQLRFESASKKC